MFYKKNNALKFCVFRKIYYLRQQKTDILIHIPYGQPHDRFLV